MGIESAGRYKGRQKEPESKEEELPASFLTRRRLIQTGLGAIAAGVAGYEGLHYGGGEGGLATGDRKKSERPLTEEEKAELELKEKFEKAHTAVEEAKPETLPTEGAEGVQVRGLEYEYLGQPRLGHHHRLEENITVDAPRALFDLWERKLKLMKLDSTKEKHSAATHARDAQDRSIELLAYDRVFDYADRWNHPEKYIHLISKVSENPDEKRVEALGRTTLDGARRDIAHRIAPMREAFKTRQLKDSLEYAYGIHDEARIAAAHSLIERISPDMMLSYSMTELLYGAHGETNAIKYDLLLRVLGKRYLASIPSLGDRVKSLGEYQMTDQGLKDTSAKGDVWMNIQISRIGASRPNSILPDDLMIPNHLDELITYEDHAAAAYLYAVNIVASIVNQVPKPLTHLLGDPDVMTDTTLMSFIATSHNSPSHARRAFLSWIEARGRDEHISFEACCDHQIREYARKSIANFNTLDPDASALAEVEGRKIAAPIGRVDEVIQELPMRKPERLTNSRGRRRREHT